MKTDETITYHDERIRPLCGSDRTGSYGIRRSWIISDYRGYRGGEDNDLRCDCICTLRGGKRRYPHIGDFAKPDTKTYVELTFLHRKRSYKITRNPRYLRPKKSGEGMTTESADAVLEMPDGTVITGFRDVTAEITEIMGINYKQFKQIAMLAQGEFLKLLLADSKERGDIFRRVFGTRLYQSAGRLLKDKERDGRRRCEDTEKQILQCFSLVSCPEGEWGESYHRQLEEASIHDSDELLERLKELIKKDRNLQDELKEKLKSSEEKLSNQITVIAEASAVNQLFEQRKAAEKRQDELWNYMDRHEGQKKDLDDAKHALYTIYPLERESLREKKDAERLAGEIDSLKEKNSELSEKMKQSENEYQKQTKKEPEREKLASAIDRLTKALPAYDQADLLKRQLKSLTKKRADLQAEQERLLKQKIEHEDRKKEQNEKLDKMASLEVRLEKSEQEVERIHSRTEDLEDVKSHVDNLADMRQSCGKLQNDFQKAESRFEQDSRIYHESERAFYREQAGIMAEKLEDGVPCPVCGSMEHPEKAVIADGAPSEETLQKLKKQSEASREKMQRCSERAAAKKAEIELAEGQLRETVEKLFPEADKEDIREERKSEQEVSSKLSELLDTELQNCRKLAGENAQNLQDCHAKIRDKKACKEELSCTERQLRENENRRTEVEEEKTRISSEVDSKTGELKNIQASLEYEDRQKAKEQKETWTKELREQKDAFKKAEDTFYDLRNAYNSSRMLLGDKVQQHTETEQSGKEALKNYQEKLTAAGFADEAAYHSALKTEDEIHEIEKEIQKFEDEWKSVRQEFNRLEAETKGKERQDLDKLQEQKVLAEQRKKKIDSGLQMVLSRLGNNEQILKSLEKVIKNFSGYTKKYLLISDLSKTANGELSGKQKLAFEQYVQAAYFQQILMEADKRLREMTNGRYELVRRENASDFRSQTGLDIDVMDHYTGRLRSVKSLSGGESFKASLSLALGLSDVIQGHAGGVEIDTLFIDEGFGALDDQSLEQAIQTLSRLADGNRLVGIISHVSELKERIDRQVVIKKSNRGSSVNIRR